MAFPSNWPKEFFDMEAFIKEVVYAHNVYRYLHNVPPLILHEHLTMQSQNSAQDILLGVARSDSKYPDVGENIFVGTNNPKYMPKGVHPVNAWYHLRDQKNACLNPDNEVNFTQIIWKNTRFLGVGMARSNNKIVMVCQYLPPGNVDGEYWHNVLPVVDELEEKTFGRAYGPTNPFPVWDFKLRRRDDFVYKNKKPSSSSDE